ncbi:MAG: GNAT family N-acetyltransferase [Coriobacteriales bacterium]|nr:GNAT family N-acetyltransferase [Coriobacteriales bacterium]
MVLSDAKNKPLFTIRQADKRDLDLLASLFISEHMPVPSDEDLLSGTVAVNDDDEVVGFIRIRIVLDEICANKTGNYVYPVIVFANWRDRGVARALCDYELSRHGELKLVACSASQDFYPRAGFAFEDWSNIASVIAQDCKQCPDLTSCNPQPFRKKAED